jgi:nucleoside-diphosphate-sugar epimerase
MEAGTGRPTTINEIAEVVRSTTGTNVDIVHLPMRAGEDERSVVLGDPTTLAPLDIYPEQLVRLEDGVRYAVDYFSEYLLGVPA